MKFYNTSDYLTNEIAKKEAELKKLKKEVHDAQVREFYWHINNRLHEMDENFYNSPWTISFDGKTITLPNFAEVFQGIEQTIADYMDDEGIEYKKEEETYDFVIMSNDFEHTGGGVWVLFSEIYLPNEKTTIYATTDDCYCFFYYNEENFYECENPDYEIYCDNIEDAVPKYRDIARVLFAHFDINLAKVGG